jgi:hypothetical protein
LTAAFTPGTTQPGPVRRRDAEAFGCATCRPSWAADQGSHGGVAVVAGAPLAPAARSGRAGELCDPLGDVRGELNANRFAILLCLLQLLRLLPASN